MPEIQRLRSRLLEQSLLLCRTEERNSQLECLRRIIFTAQSIIEQLSIVPGQGDDLEKRHENPVKSTNSSYTRRVPPVGIGHLPVETLRHIFQDYREENTTVRLSCLMRVSRHWRDIVSNDPHLWNRIHIVPTGFLSNIEWYHNHTKRCLRRSRGSPLDVTVDLSRVEWMPNYLEPATGALIPSGYLDSHGYQDWGFDGFGDDIKHVYTDQFLDILRLLVGLPAASTFLEKFFPEDDEREMEDVDVKATISTDNVLGGCQSFRLIVPSFFGIGFMSDIWRLLEDWTGSLRHLSIKVDLYDEEDAVVWPQHSKSQLYALHQLSFNFPVDLDSVSCNPATLRDLTVHIDDSFLTLGQFTSLERLNILQIHGLLLAEHSPPSLSLPRLRYLTVDSSILEFYPLDFDLPSLHRLRIIFYYDVDKIDFKLLPSVKNLDLAVDTWSKKSFSLRPRYKEDDLHSIFYLLGQCTMLESLRFWEHVRDAKGTVFMGHILSEVVYGQLKDLQNFRHVAFVQPKSGSKDMDGCEVSSYDIKAAVQNFQPK